MTEQKIEMIELRELHADSNLRGTTDCSISIQDPTDLDFTSGLSESDSFRNRGFNSPRDCRDVLGLFVLLTDTCLCIGAIIFVISLVIVFSIVVLAVVRAYTLSCYYDSNMNIRSIVNRTSSCGALASKYGQIE